MIGLIPIFKKKEISFGHASKTDSIWIIFWIQDNKAWGDTRMASLSLGPRLRTIDLPLRNTRRQGRTCILGLVSRSRAATGDLLELLGVLHNTERVVMVVVPLLMMMMRLKIIGLSQGRGIAPIESQMMTMVMMMRR